MGSTEYCFQLVFVFLCCVPLQSPREFVRAYYDAADCDDEVATLYGCVCDHCLVEVIEHLFRQRGVREDEQPFLVVVEAQELNSPECVFRAADSPRAQLDKITCRTLSYLLYILNMNTINIFIFTIHLVRVIYNGMCYTYYYLFNSRHYSSGLMTIKM